MSGHTRLNPVMEVLSEADHDGIEENKMEPPAADHDGIEDNKLEPPAAGVAGSVASVEAVTSLSQFLRMR